MCDVLNMLDKPIIELKSAKTLGVVTDILCSKNYKKLLYVVLRQEDEFFALPYSKIRVNGHDALITNASVKPIGDLNMAKYSKSILHRTVFFDNGGFVGTIENIIISGGLVHSLIISGKEYNAELIKKVGHSLVLLSAEPTINFASILDIPIPDNTPIVNVLPVNKIKTHNFSTKNYEFLLGKLITANIFNHEGKLLLLQGTYITQDVLQLAIKHNIINELINYS